MSTPQQPGERHRETVAAEALRLALMSEEATYEEIAAEVLAAAETESAARYEALRSGVEALFEQTDPWDGDPTYTLRDLVNDLRALLGADGDTRSGT